MYPFSMPSCELPPDARSICPIANTLDILGDRWTLLVVRDLLFQGKRRFGELLASPESIPTNILADRLRRLEETGVVVKVPYQTRPQRFEYHPTAKGTDLFPILLAIIDWASRHIPGTPSMPEKLQKLREQAEAALHAATEAEDSGG
jgi:DNA-binding HxlR family transcriptional regulator